MPPPVIVWFRQDLRLADNPALSAAAATGAPVIPLFILEEDAADPRPRGGASRWWLHGSLTALSEDLARAGSPLVLRRGPPAAVLDALIAETGAEAVLWNRRYEPAPRARDETIKAALKARGLRVESFNGALLFEPWTVRSKSGGPYRVFTPFWKACLALPEPPAPLPAPGRLAAPATPPAGERLADWGLRPIAPDWAGGLRDTWTPGEAGARERLAAFLDGPVTVYKAERDRPDRESVSRLSPHLHVGEVGPRQVWHAARHTASSFPERAAGVDAFLRQVGWRDFSASLLHHLPFLPESPLDERFARFPWRDDPAGLAAWRRGLTGYPIVDAGMRQLWRTGWMHNRVRMIAASFLVKDLLIPWQAGEAWFRDTLVDADLANNAASWQWVAGCGADAAPYFRIFNPVLQGETFDPAGAYVRRWVPELADLPGAWIHKPWEAPPAVLAGAGVRLGHTYPRPLVDHAAARARALAALETIRDS